MADPAQTDHRLLRIEPETPEQLAAFKRARSREHQRRQTLVNLALALAASLGVLLLLVLVVVRPERVERAPIDYPEVAEQAAAALGWPVAMPALPAGWWANAAELRTGADDGLPYWYLGVLTDREGYLGLEQRPDADPTWVTRSLGGAFATGTEVIDGIEWQVFDRRSGGAASANQAYALAAALPVAAGRAASAGSPTTTTVILYGTAGSDEFRHFAGAVTASLLDESEAR